MLNDRPYFKNDTSVPPRFQVSLVSELLFIDILRIQPITNVRNVVRLRFVPTDSFACDLSHSNCFTSNIAVPL